MENQYYDENYEAKQGSVITGMIGALLGALIGAAVWAGVAIGLEIISGLIGLLIGFLASKGYDLLKGRQGVPKLVCVIIAVIFGVVIGTGASYVWQIHDVYMEEFGELTGIAKSLAPSEKEIFEVVLADKEVQGEIAKNLVMGLFFAALGCFDIFREILAKPKAQPVTDVNAAAVPGIDAAAVPQQPAEEQPSDQDGTL